MLRVAYQSCEADPRCSVEVAGALVEILAFLTVVLSVDVN